MLWKQKHESYYAIQGLHLGQQGSKVCMALFKHWLYSTLSTKSYQSFWAKSHRTGGPAVQPAEVKGLRDPSWYLQCCLREQLSFCPRRQPGIQLPSPAAAVHSTAGSQMVGSHEAQEWENTSLSSQPSPGAAGRRGKEASKCCGISSKKATTRAKTQSETTGAKLKRKNPSEHEHRERREGGGKRLVSQA